MKMDKDQCKSTVHVETAWVDLMDGDWNMMKEVSDLFFGPQMGVAATHGHR